MTIKETIYNFYWFEFRFSLFNFFNHFCKHWTFGPRCFCPLKGAEQMFFVLFPQESLFCKARHSVRFLPSVIKVNCSLHVIKHLSTLCINFHWIYTWIVYTDSPRVDRWSKMYPTSLVALERFQEVQDDIYKRVKNTSCRCDGRCSSLYRQSTFHM